MKHKWTDNDDLQKHKQKYVVCTKKETYLKLYTYVCLALSLANIFSEPQTSCISVSYYSGTSLNKLFQIKFTIQNFYPKG